MFSFWPVVGHCSLVVVTVISVVLWRCKQLLCCVNWKDIHCELQRLVELRLLLLELSERISMNLLDITELPKTGIDQVLHCVYTFCRLHNSRTFYFMWYDVTHEHLLLSNT